jgi:signal transduction histidine kinase
MFKLKRTPEALGRVPDEAVGRDRPDTGASFASFAKLVAWLRVRPSRESDVAAILIDMASTLGADRAAMTWECREEPAVHVAWLEEGRCFWRAEEPGALGQVVEPALIDADFHCDDLRARPRMVRNRFAESAVPWTGPVLDSAVASRFAASSVTSWRLNGNAVDGRLFLFDRRGMDGDDLRAGAVAADLVTAVLDSLYLLTQTHERAVADERLRYARELHDGVVQSLTGVALQLRVVGQYLLDDRAMAQKRLREIEGLVSAEQRSLRTFVKLLRLPQPVRMALTIEELRDRLELVAARSSLQWGLSIKVTVDGASPDLSVSAGEDVERLVTEALVNVGRHAGGSSALVEVTCFERHLLVAVVDNGRGFPFQGRYGHDDLAALTTGPISLRQRAASVGGTLTIESSHRGARVEFMLPLVRGKTASI